MLDKMRSGKYSIQDHDYHLQVMFIQWSLLWYFILYCHSNDNENPRVTRRVPGIMKEEKVTLFDNNYKNNLH